MDWISPDWSRIKNIAASGTIQEYGYIIGSGRTEQDSIWVKINNNTVAYGEAYGAQDTSGEGCFIMVAPGNTWTSRGMSLQFVPMKGTR